MFQFLLASGRARAQSSVQAKGAKGCRWSIERDSLNVAAVVDGFEPLFTKIHSGWAADCWIHKRWRLHRCWLLAGNGPCKLSKFHGQVFEQREEGVLCRTIFEAVPAGLFSKSFVL